MQAAQVFKWSLTRKTDRFYNFRQREEMSHSLFRSMVKETIKKESNKDIQDQ